MRIKKESEKWDELIGIHSTGDELAKASSLQPIPSSRKQFSSEMKQCLSEDEPRHPRRGLFRKRTMEGGPSLGLECGCGLMRPSRCCGSCGRRVWKKARCAGRKGIVFAQGQLWKSCWKFQ
ncbi:hypothetical protein AVEN_40167-1 [Araneus ventricosus]|uniref:Uncharacterized protein n=1 Tax=Araneus ventricosus TaxID=182803 RepID=A0A4Y2PGL7_ARAVE|nr:hypothetical protein AVEN_40167-1 [Araneus ventricosus]